MSVEYNAALFSLIDIKKMIVDLGYQVLDETIGTSAQEIEARKLMYLFFVGVAVILYSYPEIFKFIPIAGTNISAYLIFVFASIVQFVTGSRFYIIISYSISNQLISSNLLKAYTNHCDISLNIFQNSALPCLWLS